MIWKIANEMPAVEGGRQGEDAIGRTIFSPIIADPSINCQVETIQRLQLGGLLC
jgi:hypothetical protein